MGQVKESCIGIFDSGIGGFSILKEIHKVMPGLDVLYVADEAFAPYGNRTQEEVISRSRFISKELIARGVTLIVVACNTATAMAIDTLRKEFDIDFVGVEPFVNAISKFNLDHSAVITTELMAKSDRFLSLKENYDTDGVLDYFVTKNLASIIEKYFIDSSEEQLLESLEKELSFLKESTYSSLILGCTHYPLISSHIEAITGLRTISPCPYVAHRVLNLLGTSDNNTVSLEQFSMAKTSVDNSLRFVSKDFSNLV